MDSLLLSPTKEGSLNNYKECHFLLVPIENYQATNPTHLPPLHLCI